MNRTLKALGLGLFAALAISAFAVMGASADVTKHTGGHFTVDGNPTYPVKLHGQGGEAGNPHLGHLKAFGTTVTCLETYSGTVTAQTSESVTITPLYTNCSDGRVVTMNGCRYTFTFRDTSVSTLHNEVHLVCDGQNTVEVHAAGECTITFPPQSITDAVTYTTILVKEKHALTVDFTAKQLRYLKHGLCEFLSPFGTGPHSGAQGAELNGTATIAGTDALNAATGITATGTNNH